MSTSLAYEALTPLPDVLPLRQLPDPVYGLIPIGEATERGVESGWIEWDRSELRMAGLVSEHEAV